MPNLTLTLRTLFEPVFTVLPEIRDKRLTNQVYGFFSSLSKRQDWMISNLRVRPTKIILQLCLKWQAIVECSYYQTEEVGAES